MTDDHGRADALLGVLVDGDVVLSEAPEHRTSSSEQRQNPLSDQGTAAVGAQRHDVRKASYSWRAQRYSFVYTMNWLYLKQEQ